MFELLLKVMLLVHACVRCEVASRTYSFVRVSNATKMPYVHMSSSSTKERIECLALCGEGCLFLKYQDNGSGSGTCDLYHLRDTVYSSLKFVNMSNLYKKVYPPSNVFVGILALKTWYEARDFCQSLGGNLAIADSTAKVDRMYELLSFDMWVGGQKNGTTWKWVSGAVVTQSVWEDDLVSPNLCLELYTKKLAVWSCNLWLKSVCEL